LAPIPRSRAPLKSTILLVATICTLPVPIGGLAEGDLVRVFNDRGAYLAAARLSDRIRPGVVRLSTRAS
jgi:Molydopterin dinucleotide binding domain